MFFKTVKYIAAFIKNDFGHKNSAIDLVDLYLGIRLSVSELLFSFFLALYRITSIFLPLPFLRTLATTVAPATKGAPTTKPLLPEKASTLSKGNLVALVYIELLYKENIALVYFCTAFRPFRLLQTRKAPLFPYDSLNVAAYALQAKFMRQTIIPL